MCLFVYNLFLLLDYTLGDISGMSFIILSPKRAQCEAALMVEWRQQVPLTFVMGASMVMEWILAMDG